MAYSLVDFSRQFPNNDACLKYLFEQRFKSPTCPKCGRKGRTFFHKNKHLAAYTCNCGRFHIYPMKGTIFGGSKGPLEKWFLAMYLMANAKEGITSVDISRQVGVTYKTAWRMSSTIRKMIAAKSTEMVVVDDPIGMRRDIKDVHQHVSEENLHLYLSEFQYRSKFWKTGQNLFFLLLSMAVGESSRDRKQLIENGPKKSD
jgi:transposase-like protein